MLKFQTTQDRTYFNIYTPTSNPFDRKISDYNVKNAPLDQNTEIEEPKEKEQTGKGSRNNFDPTFKSKVPSNLHTPAYNTIIRSYNTTSPLNNIQKGQPTYKAPVPNTIKPQLRLGALRFQPTSYDNMKPFSSTAPFYNNPYAKPITNKLPFK